MRNCYTKELLEDVVRRNVSMAGVLRSLGLRLAGGTQSYLTGKIKGWGIDTRHFTGQATNHGPNHKGPRKRTWREVLIKRVEGHRESCVRLRRALIESGVPYQCVCGLQGTWNDRPLMLQVNHKNKDWLDDRRANLEFLCPNCHSQTEGWSGSKGMAEITTTSLRCKSYRKRKR